MVQFESGNDGTSRNSFFIQYYFSNPEFLNVSISVGGPCKRNSETALEGMECRPPVSTIMMGVPPRGMALRTMHPEDFMLLWSLSVCCPASHHIPHNLSCMETLRGFPAPHWALPLALTIIIISITPGVD